MKRSKITILGIGMPNPRTAAEWAEKCRDHMALPATGIAGTLCLNCAEQYARLQVEAALAAMCKMVRGHATRIAEADKGKGWPTNETAADVGLLTALAMEIETFVIGR